MNRKFGQLTILGAFIFFATLIGCIYLGIVSIIENRERRINFLEAIDVKYNSSERFIFRQIEFSLREGDLPYYSQLVGESIKSKLGLSSVKIFDKSLRLIYTSSPTNEIFQSELRHDENPIEPGSSRLLASGENVYRSVSGDFFVQYPKPYIPKPLLENPNLEYGFSYWLFDDKTGTVHFTNDYNLLNGDREVKDLLNLFQGNEGQKISWQVNGRDGLLERFDTPNYSIYIIDSGNFFPKWAFPRAILISLLTFSGLCLLKLTLVVWNGKAFPLSNLSKKNILFFLISLLFYQGITSYLPDFRYYKPWTKMRWEQSESLLYQLEKNILNQVSETDTDVDIKSKQFDPIVKEFYFWKANESTSRLTNRFSIEIHTFLENLNAYESSRLIESNFEYLFIVPIQNQNQQKTYVILVLDPLLMGAKKERDRDEFYLPNNSFRLSEDAYGEKYNIHPKLWDNSILANVRHLKSGFSEFSLFGNPFKVYVYSPGLNIPSLTDGLFLYKSEGVFQILIYVSFFSFFPLLLLSLLAKFRRIEKELLPEPVSTNVEESELVEGEDLISDLHAEPEIPVDLKPKIELEAEQEAIAETNSPVHNGGVIVKKQIHQYIPPSLWSKMVPSLPGEIQKKRDTIFTPELKSLVEQVTTSEISVGRRQSDDRKMPALWAIPEEKKVEYALLDRVYRGDEVSLDGIVEYTRNFIQRLGSPRFSFLFLNDTIGSYHSQISFGLDYNTRSNLIFLYNDPFLQFDDKGYAAIEINEKVKLDKFISKKFSWEILAQIETILAFNLENSGFPGLFLILLDKQEKTKFMEPHKRMILEKLRQLIPALHVLMEKEDKTPDLFEDSLSWMVRSFLQATLGGKRNAFVSHVIWENYHPTDANEAKKAAMLQEVTKIVESKDRVIENSPNAFLVLSEKDIKEPMEKLLKSYPFPYETRYMKYPDDGENYYLYI